MVFEHSQDELAGFRLAILFDLSNKFFGVLFDRDQITIHHVFRSNLTEREERKRERRKV